MCGYPDHRGTVSRLDLGIYVELQEYSDSIAGDVFTYCDFTKGLTCKVEDASGRPPEPMGNSYSGGAPTPQWISLPPFASVRLRANAYSGGKLRDGGLGLWFTGAGDWTIKPSDTNAYYMSAKLVVSPPPNTNNFNHTQIWSGTLSLPKMKVWPLQ